MQKEPLVALTNAFTSAEASLKATKDIKAMSSGTTVAVVYAAGDTLYVANAGDTRVVVARHVRDSERQKLVDVADAGETPCVNPPVSGAAGSNQVGNASTSHSTRIINTVISNVPVLPKCDKCCPIMLTVDHKPDDPVEMARITAHKGYVSVPVHASSSTSVNSTFAGPSSIDADGNITDEFFDTVPAEPLKKQAVGSVAAARVWLDPKHTLVGLAMSRSIGDFAAKTVGVTATPSVIKYNVHTNDKFMIIASDGVWEFMDIQDAVNIVQTNLHLGAFTACQVLIQAAEKLWRKNEGDYRDDVSIDVCVYCLLCVV